MVSTQRTNFNRETIMPSIKPEVMEFFQNQIDPNMTPEQITDAIESLKPNSQSNPILGTPVNLLYLRDGNNLAAVVIQENSNGNLYTLSAEPELNAQPDTVAIRIDNLKDFQFRLQDALNHDSSVSIYHENGRIESMVIIKREQNNSVIPENTSLLSVGRPSGCYLPPNGC